MSGMQATKSAGLRVGDKVFCRIGFSGTKTHPAMVREAGNGCLYIVPLCRCPGTQNGSASLVVVTGVTEHTCGKKS